MKLTNDGLNLPPESGAQEWFRDAFGALYPRVYSHRNRDAGRKEIIRLVQWLSLRPADRILDICCGEGRHLETLRGMGFHALGLDLSITLLRNAAAHPILKGRVFRADIRSLPVAPRFSVALNLFTSFGYFDADADNAAALEQMLSCLVPGGTLVVDHINRENLLRNLVPESDDRYDGYRLVQRRRITGNRVIKEITWISDRGEHRTFRENVRIYGPDEMIRMVRSAGGSDIRLAGGFDGRPFREDSGRMIVCCRRGSPA